MNTGNMLLESVSVLSEMLLFSNSFVGRHITHAFACTHLCIRIEMHYMSILASINTLTCALKDKDKHTRALTHMKKSKL